MLRVACFWRIFGCISVGSRRRTTALTGQHADCLDPVSIQQRRRRRQRLAPRSGTSSAPTPARPNNRGAVARENAVKSVWLRHQHGGVPRVVSRPGVDTNVTYFRVVTKTLDTIQAGIRAGRWPPPENISDLDCILCVLVDDMMT